MKSLEETNGVRQLKILDLLEENGPLTTSELADMFGKEPGYIRQGASRLRKRELIVSVPNVRGNASEKLHILEGDIDD